MKKIALLVLFLSLLIGDVSAYYINISAPRTINAGEKLIVNGSSRDIPPGFSTTIQLSQVGRVEILDQKVITIQEGGFFSLILNIDSLAQGTYKLELAQQDEYPYGSGSRTWLFFDIIDRRNELSLLAPLTQTKAGSLTISGTIASVGAGGLRIIIEHEGATFFGPEYIQTSADGSFEKNVNISEEGQYLVSLTDTKGYTWFVTYTSIQPITTAPTSPLVTTTSPASTSATLSASRNEPAYFRVSAGQGVMRAYTSEGVDWVMEYINETGAKMKVNTRGTAAEEVTLSVSGGTVYFKVYPDRYEDHASVTLYVTNARAVEPCTSCAGLFEAGTTPTEATPLPYILAIIAIFGVIVLRKLS